MEVSVCQCAACDQASANLGSDSSAVSTGAKWGSPTFGTAAGVVTWSYASLNFSGRTQFDFSMSFLPSGYQSEIQRAFDAWEAVANIDFQQVSDGADVDIRLGGDPIDGTYGVLGYATWWYSGAQLQQADIVFDVAEPWSTTSGGISVYSVAVHEIGHAIGLAHQTGVTAIMNPYNSNLQSLQAADIASIQAIYGPVTGYGEIIGTANNDTINGTSGNDTIRGRDGNDQLDGLGGNDQVFGEGGHDTLYGRDGNDSLDGGDGNDTLNGGVGRDVLTGGGGADRFVFSAAAETAPGANRDVVNGFSSAQGDKIDLSAIDGSTLVSGTQLFGYIGPAAFSSVAGELRFADGILSGDRNGDGVADFEIQLTGVTSLQPTDFTSIDRAPVVSAASLTLANKQPIAAASLFTTSDADNDAMTKYQLWDGTATSASGKFLVNGVAQAANVDINVTAAQLAQTTFQPGSGTDQLWVRAFDGILWSEWKSFSVTAPPNAAPVVSAANLTAPNSNPIAASSLFTVSDADGDTITAYRLWDSSAAATSGKFLVNGVAQGTNVNINLSASQLAQTVFQPGTSGTDDLWVQVSDGAAWSAWKQFYVSAPVAAATPEVTVLGNGASITDGDTTPGSADHTSFGSASVGGATIVRTFTVRNDGGSTLTLGTPTAPSGFTIIEPLVSSLAAGASDTFQVRLDTGTAGTKSGQISFTSNDSNESPFNFTITGTVTAPSGGVNVAPVVSVANLTAPSSQPIAAATLFTVTDANSDAMTKYQFWDSTAAATSGKFLINGAPQSTNVNIDVTAAQLAQTTFQPGTSGTDDLWVRAFDGALWSAWKQFFVTAPAGQALSNNAPVVGASDLTAANAQPIAASSLFSVTDADNDTITKYQLLDGTAAGTSGTFLVNGVAQGAGTSFEVTAAQLAQTTFQPGTSGSDALQVRAFDGTDWSDWASFNVNAPAGNQANVAPVVSVSNITGTKAQPTLDASSLFTVSDANGDSMTAYRFWDSTVASTSGKFLVNGVAQPANANIDVTAAQLAQTVFQLGTVDSDSLWVQAFDGQAWSEWKQFSVTAPVNQAPVVSVSDQTAPNSQPIAAASLFTVSDADGDTITNYQLWDGTSAASSGKFLVNGVAQGTNVNIDVTAAQLAQTTFQPGTSGFDDLWVRAFDGAAWSAWKQFDLAAPAAQNLSADSFETDGVTHQLHVEADEFVF